MATQASKSSASGFGSSSPPSEKFPQYFDQSLGYGTAALMTGLDEALPYTNRIALTRVNELRALSGLPPFTYDPSMRPAAQKHARYCVLNMVKGVAANGHFELEDNEYYSKEGHEASKRSGLSMGEHELRGLDGLLAGPYHRRSFMTIGPKRCAIGYMNSWSGDAECDKLVADVESAAGGQRNHARKHSRFAFYSLADDEYTEHTVAPQRRFYVWPPPNSEDIPCQFYGENPDPRPDTVLGKAVEMSEFGSPLTGYPVAVNFYHPEDQKSVVKSSATLHDIDNGNRSIDCGVTDCANPSIKELSKEKALALWGAAPEAGSSSPVTTTLGGQEGVWIFPWLPLPPGHWIAVKVECSFSDGHVERFDWKFKTRGRGRDVVPMTPGEDDHEKECSSHPVFPNTDTSHHAYFASGSLLHSTASDEKNAKKRSGGGALSYRTAAGAVDSWFDANANTWIRPILLTPDPLLLSAETTTNTTIPHFKPVPTLYFFGLPQSVVDGRRFSLSAEQPIVNGKPHFAAANCHLYFTQGKWLFKQALTPDSSAGNSFSAPAEDGSLMVGTSVPWKSYTVPAKKTDAGPQVNTGEWKPFNVHTVAWFVSSPAQLGAGMKEKVPPPPPPPDDGVKRLKCEGHSQLWVEKSFFIRSKEQPTVNGYPHWHLEALKPGQHIYVIAVPSSKTGEKRWVTKQAPSPESSASNCWTPVVKKKSCHGEDEDEEAPMGKREWFAYSDVTKTFDPKTLDLFEV